MLALMKYLPVKRAMGVAFEQWQAENAAYAIATKV
jgi:hypothetical protein